MTNQPDEILIPHTGKFRYHDDDCMCGAYGSYCNRDGYVWSCCGACKQHSDCTGNSMHPTYWNHSQVSKTMNGDFSNNKPLYKSNAEIRKLFPDLFR